MRGHRQGAIVHGVHDLGTEVPLYDFSGMHDMAGLGVDLGQEVALYDFSGAHDMGALGIDLGNPLTDVVERTRMAYDGLPQGVKTAVTIAGVLGIAALITGGIKAKSLNPLNILGLGKKKRTNRRRRRRRNGVHASARRNRTTTRRRRRNRSVTRRRRRNPARRRRSRR